MKHKARNFAAYIAKIPPLIRVCFGYLGVELKHVYFGTCIGKSALRILISAVLLFDSLICTEVGLRLLGRGNLCPTQNHI